MEWCQGSPWSQHCTENQRLQDISILYDHFLFSLTREDYIEFREMDIEPMPNTRSYHGEPTKPMTTFYGHTKPSTISELQTVFNNFKRDTKRDASAYPIFKNDLYYDMFQRSFMVVIKAQGLYDVVDPDYDPDDGDQYKREPFQEKQYFVYSVLVTSLQTERGRELVKEFEGDARSIISELQHHHTKSNVAQHEIVKLTTYITNLSLTNSWKGTTTKQFLSHFKDQLRLLDSLVPDTDKLPDNVRVTFLQRAVQQNHDLRQIHVLDSVWRSKTGSTGKLTFEVYYHLLWGAAYQYDLHKHTKQPPRKAFISHQDDLIDVLEHGSEEEDPTNDHSPDELLPYSVYKSSFNPPAPKWSPTIFIPFEIWGRLPEASKKMIIEYNKKHKVNSPKPYLNGGNTIPNPTLVKPNPTPQQVHAHETDDPTACPPSEPTTQTMVYECLAEDGTDPSDIQNVMSGFNTKGGNSSQHSPRKIQVQQRYVFARANQSTHHLIDRGANGGLAGADMRVLQKTHRKINIVGIDDHELTGLNVTAAALLDTQKGPIIGIFMSMLTLVKAGLFMLLDKWNGSTAKLMTDQRLLLVHKELKHLMDM